MRTSPGYARFQWYKMSLSACSRTGWGDRLLQEEDIFLSRLLHHLHAVLRPKLPGCIGADSQGPCSAQMKHILAHQTILALAAAVEHQSAPVVDT